MTAERFWKAVGGRKQFNGYLYALLISIAVVVMDGTFDAYAMWLAGALLTTSVIVAAEDRKGSRAPGARRASDQPAGETTR